MAAASRAPTGSSQVLQHRPAVGAQTTTQTSTQAVLHLRGAVRTSEQEASDGEGEGSASKRRIQWAEDVIDNEGMGKKKSKVCCIYHAPKEFGESSDESSSDSDDSESDSGDDGAARPARKKDNGHSHGDGHNHNHDHGRKPGQGKGNARARSPNAYEKMPKVKGPTKEA